MIDGEPRFGPWQVHRVEDILAELLPAPGPPRILAVDGRSGSGKTTAAERMAGRVPGSAVVHTDDIVWNHAMFDWAELITEGEWRIADRAHRLVRGGPIDTGNRRSK